MDALLKLGVGNACVGGDMLVKRLARSGKSAHDGSDWHIQDRCRILVGKPINTNHGDENLLVRRYFWPGCHRMRPYRDLHPHAGLLLPHTQAIARRVVVLPTGTTLPDTAAGVVADVIGVLARGA